MSQIEPDQWLTSAAWRQVVAALPPAQHWWVAYSGGLDSHCLLHALCHYAPRPLLTAVHVDHGIHPSSAQWAQHCERVCAGLQVACQSVRIQVTPMSGESLEAVARTARYDALARLIGPGDVLFTAHHQDDQAETLLLQLLRGAGPRGLAAMPFLAPFHAGYLARPLLHPLLHATRSALLVYARAAHLVWIEDESNAELHYQRNYVRHQLFPILLQRWPAVSETLSRAATHQAESARLLEDLAAQDLSTLLGPRPKTVQIAPLLALGAVRARNVLHYWIHHNGHAIPSADRFERILREVASVPRDATPLLSWHGTELRRYRDLIYLMPPLVPAPVADWEVIWPDLDHPLHLPWGVLTAKRSIGSGLTVSVCTAGVTVRMRRGGERCRFGGSAHHRPLKDLWQEMGVPPWERLRTPLLFLKERLIAVPGLCVYHPFQAQPPESGFTIEWQRT